MEISKKSLIYRIALTYTTYCRSDLYDVCSFMRAVAVGLFNIVTITLMSSFVIVSLIDPIVIISLNYINSTGVNHYFNELTLAVGAALYILSFGVFVIVGSIALYDKHIRRSTPNIPNVIPPVVSQWFEDKHNKICTVIDFKE